MALVLAASLYGLAASGHFPRPDKSSAPALGVGSLPLLGSMALVIAAFASGLIAALHHIPWYTAVIGGGLSVLSAPLVLQWFPDRFVDNRGALFAFTASSAALAMLLMLAVCY